MPTVKVKTASGSVNFYYTISTPRETSAKSIDPALPTVLWFHPLYTPSTLYYAQFLDPSIRRFNLVALDSRSHGNTTGSKPVKRYNELDAAEEAFNFMEAIKLPPCHVIGNDMGASIALALAMTHPNRVLSCFAIAPLPPTEPQDVKEGRNQVYEYWEEGVRSGDNSLIQEAIWGAAQLTFSGISSPLIEAQLAVCTPIGIANWGGNMKNAEQFKLITHDFFVDRKPLPKNQLAKIACPVRLAYCTGDLGYTRDHFMELYNLFQGAGVNVSKVDIPNNACRYAPCTHPHETNAAIVEHLDMFVPGASAFQTPRQVTSPFEADLAKYGYVADDSDEEL